MKKTYLLLVFWVFAFCVQAQGQPDKATLQEYRNNPQHWIRMMNDPNANYYEAVAAFEEYWRGKPNPLELAEGEEEEGEYEERSVFSRLFKSEKKWKEELIKYAMDYKKFKFWQMQNQGFIKPNGRVMSQDEIQALVEQELRNRQNSNK